MEKQDLFLFSRWEECEGVSLKQDEIVEVVDNLISVQEQRIVRYSACSDVITTIPDDQLSAQSYALTLYVFRGQCA